MARIVERPTKAGTRYDVRVLAPDGKVRSKTFPTITQAKNHAATVEADKVRGRWHDSRAAATPFGEVAEAWEESNPAKRASARERDHCALKAHLLPALESRPVSTITTPDVRKLVATWSRAGLKPRTVRRTFGTLRAVLNFAVDAEMLTRNPCRGVKMPAIEPIVAHVVTADDLARLADALGPRYAGMALLGAVCGLRWAEVAGLQYENIGVGTVTVAQQLGRDGQLGPPKSHAGRRTLAVPEAVLELLPDGTEGLVFTQESGRPLGYSHWRRNVWLPAVSAAGLEGLSFHDLRRANATALVAAGVDLKTAGTRLGHSDVRLTLQLYAQATTAADVDAASKLGSHFLP